MEHFNAQVEHFQQQIARQKELTQELEQLHTSLEERKNADYDRRLKVAQAKFDLEKAENPGFFTRLMGRQEEAMSKARAAYREASAALETHRRELAELENRITEAKLEAEQLSGCDRRCRQFLEEHRDTVPLARTLYSRFCAENAIEAAWGISRALEQARPWMQTDVRYTYVSEKNQKLAFLAEADRHADELRDLLSRLPEGLVTPGAALSSPSGYVNSATMEYAQLDRLDTVLNRARDAREALRAFLATLE